jgi:hypothetical protein
MPGCRPAGETCMTGCDCCGGVCSTLTEGGPLLCALLSDCRVAGETCTSPGDCCSGQCGGMGPTKCQALPACHPAFELCKTPMDCCSGRCDLSPEGVKRCAWAPGCRPAQERCSSSEACCSGMCMGPPGDGRCGGMPGPMMSRCLDIGQVCKKATDCCNGALCGPDAAGVLRCSPSGSQCVADGYPCALDAECCGTHCLPDADGVLSCHSNRAPLGAPCTASEDCGDGAACVGSPGSLICTLVDPAVTTPGCAGPGEACVATNAACCGGTVCAAVTGRTTACAPLAAVSEP